MRSIGVRVRLIWWRQVHPLYLIQECNLVMMRVFLYPSKGTIALGNLDRFACEMQEMEILTKLLSKIVIVKSLFFKLSLLE